MRLSSREEGPGGRPPETGSPGGTGSSSASGGDHDPATWDPLSGPLPSEIEKARVERERADRERLERERFFEDDRRDRERLERERVERLRLEQARIERERVERDRGGKDPLERDRLERSRLDRERAESERLQRERSDRARFQRERSEWEAFSPRSEGAERTGSQPAGRTITPVPGGSRQPSAQESTPATTSRPRVGPVTERLELTEIPRRETPTKAAPTPAPIPASETPRPTRLRPSLRRVKRTLMRVDPFSVLKLSLFFYGVFLIIWLLVVAVLYNIAQGLGWIEFLDGVSEVFAGTEANVTLGMVEKWALLLGVLFAILGSILNLLIAVIYNVAADILGGVQVTFVERDV